MTDLRTAAQQALEDLKDLHANHNITYAGTISRLEAALAQQAEPVEPVAKVIATAPKRIWLDLGFDPADEDITFDQLFEATWSQDNATGWGIEYVRADLVAPPQRKPLTQEEIIDATEHIDTSRNGYFIHIARAVERAHGIGGQE